MEQWEGWGPFSLGFHEDPECETADKKSGLTTAVAGLPFLQSEIIHDPVPWNLHSKT